MKIIKGDFPGQSGNNKESNKKLQGLAQQELFDESDASYPDMLMDLISPYLSPNPEPLELEEKLQLGVVAWNMGIAQSLGLPGVKEMMNESIKTMSIKSAGAVIVKKMMVAKQNRYGGYNNFIENIEMITDKAGKLQVVVSSRNIFDFMNSDEEVYDDFDEDFMEDEDFPDETQFEEGFVSRNALMVKPKAAFLEWQATVSNQNTAQKVPIESNVYLMNEMISKAENRKWIQKNFDRIFTLELINFTDTVDLWPANRNFKMFQAFFDVEFHGFVYDLEDEPVVKE